MNMIISTTQFTYVRICIYSRKTFLLQMFLCSIKAMNEVKLFRNAFWRLLVTDYLV